LIFTHKCVKRGESLYRAGDAFGSLYTLRAGFLKSSVVLEHGTEQITGFHMAGETMGMDGIGTGRYTLDIVALENSDVHVIPFACFERAASKGPLLQRRFHRMMGREMERCQGVMLLLGTMRAEARVVVFLLNLSMRYAAGGYSPLEFNLRMSRNEIGSYLGLTLETVSRTLSRLQHHQLLAVERKHVRILDIDGLKRVMRQES
jgi:CRP/FNR family transcriptional regulator